MGNAHQTHELVAVPDGRLWQVRAANGGLDLLALLIHLYDRRQT